MWNIVTEYQDHRGNVIKTTRAIHPNNAMESAQRRMAVGLYGKAVIAVVTDDETGEQHGYVKLHKNGALTVVYHRDAREFETRIDLDVWQRQLDRMNKGK